MLSLIGSFIIVHNNPDLMPESQVLQSSAEQDQNNLFSFVVWKLLSQSRRKPFECIKF